MYGNLAQAGCIFASAKNTQFRMTTLEDIIRIAVNWKFRRKVTPLRSYESDLEIPAQSDPVVVL